MLTITKQRDIDRIFRQGRSVHSPEMVMYMMRRTKSAVRLPGRVVFCVSKKLGCAVKRNRMRRRLREVYRLNSEILDSRCDLILLARQAVLTLPFAKLEKSFLELSRKLGVLSQNLDAPQVENPRISTGRDC